MVLPGTRDGYRALVEGLDLTTEAGQKALVALLGMAEGADAYYSYLEEIASQYRTQVEAILDPLSTAGNELAAINAYFDDLISTLLELGYTVEELAAKETDRLAILEKVGLQAAKDIISAHEMTDYEQQIKAANDWRDTQLAAWTTLQDQLDPDAYAEGLANILKAFGYLLDDIENAVTDTVQDLTDIVQDLADAMAAAANMSASLTSSIGNMKYGSGYGYGTSLEETLRSIAGMTGIPEEYRQNLIDQAQEYYDLQMDSLNAAQDTADYSKQTSQTQLDNLKALESAISKWKDTYDDLAEQILGYKTTTANPADAIERLAIAGQAILDVTGGKSAIDYVSSLGSTEEQRMAVDVLRDLYDNFLTVAQEAYQRPSEEYQTIYAGTVSQLTSLMGYMESYASSEWQVQIDQLGVLIDIRAEIAALSGTVSSSGGSSSASPTPTAQGMPQWMIDNYGQMYSDFEGMVTAGVDWTGAAHGGTAQVFADNELMKFITSTGKTFWYDLQSSLYDMFLTNPDLAKGWAEQYGSGSYATGGYIQDTGLAYVHAGEYITPRGYDYPELKQGNNVTFNLSITGNDKPEKVGKVVRNELSNFMRSGEGRKLIQSTAKGH